MELFFCVNTIIICSACYQLFWCKRFLGRFCVFLSLVLLSGSTDFTSFFDFVSIPTDFEGFSTHYFYWKIQESTFDIICSLEFESLKGFDLKQLNELNTEFEKKESDFFDF